MDRINKKNDQKINGGLKERVFITHIYRYENVLRIKSRASIYTYLYNHLCVKHPAAKYIKSVIEKKWDGIYRFFHRGSQTIPSGLLNDTVRLLKKVNEEYVIEDKRNLPAQHIDIDSNVHLRGYQEAVFDSIKDTSNGIIWLPVNAGKTHIALHMVAYKAVRTLWVTHTKKLLEQTANKMKELLEFPNELGLIGMSFHDIQPLTIGMVQTLSKNRRNAGFMKEINNNFDMVIIDECHMISHNTYTDFMKRCKAYYRYGLSGTPKHRNKLDVVQMQSVFGDIIAKMDQKTLIDLGVSVQPKIIMVEHSLDNTKFDDYGELYEYHIVNNVSRNKKVTKSVDHFVNKNKSILIMVDRIKHGENLLKELTDCGVKTEFITGQTDKDIGSQILEDFESKKLPVLIATTVLNEGINLHSMDCLIVAGAGRSPVKTVQRVGRVIRSRIGKDRAYVLDFFDTGCPILQKQAKERKSIYKQEFGSVQQA